MWTTDTDQQDDLFLERERERQRLDGGCVPEFDVLRHRRFRAVFGA